jgi:uncharacterized protein (TIGR00369 family)
MEETERSLPSGGEVEKAQRQQAQEKLFRKSFHQVPINRHLGFEVVARSPEGASILLPVRAEFVQEEGVIHGAIISAVADTSAVYVFHPDLAANETMTSIEFKINFLRPALAHRGPLLARSRLIQRGGRIGVCDVEVTQDSKLVAKGSFTYLFATKP